MLGNLVFASGNIVATEYWLPLHLTGTRDVQKRREGGLHRALMLGYAWPPPIRDRGIEKRTSMLGLIGAMSASILKVAMALSPRKKVLFLSALESTIPILVIFELYDLEVTIQCVLKEPILIIPTYAVFISLCQIQQRSCLVQCIEGT